MGFFGKAKPISEIFELQSVFSRECVELFYPKKSLYPMANMRWLELQMKNRQGPDFWVNRIFDSEKYWLSQGKQIEDEAAALVSAACHADGFTYDEESWATLFVSSKFGLLTGLFEKASNATKVKDCHPLTWNALSFFNQSIPDDIKKPFQSSNLMLLTCMPYGSYFYGKTGTVSVEEVYSRWSD